MSKAKNMMFEIQSFLSKRKYDLFLIILSLIVTREWFLPGLPSSHDPEVHISRAGAIAQSLQEGNVLPRWAGYFNSGFGSPSIMFLYPAVPYVSALIHFATQAKFIDIYKYLLVASYAASGVFWFMWMRRLKFSSKAAFVGSIYYLLAPYHLVDVFVRGALAENIGLMFFPLIFFAAEGVLIQSERKRNLLFTLTISGVILSHNLSALMFFPLVLLYPLLYLYIENKRNLNGLRAYYLSILVGLLLSAFFWVPALIESKYTLASWIFMTKDWYADHFVYFKQFIWSPWGYGLSMLGDKDGMTFQIGIAHWLVTISALVIAARLFIHKELQKQKSVISFCFLGVALILMGMFFSLSVSNPIWHNFSLMRKFQFPWRFITFIVIGTSLLAAFVAEKMNSVKEFILLVGLPLIFTINYWHVPPPSSLTEESLTTSYRGTSDTGETTPVWAVRYQDYLPKAPIEIVSSSGQVEISDVRKKNNIHEFNVSANADSRLVDNTLFFPGWKVFVDGQDVPIEYQDENWRGLITFPIKPGTHTVKVTFGETTLRKIADAISIVSAGVIIAIAVQQKRLA